MGTLTYNPTLHRGLIVDSVTRLVLPLPHLLLVDTAEVLDLDLGVGPFQLLGVGGRVALR